MAAGLPQPLPFLILADFERQATARYDRTTTYWINPNGVVEEVFPAMTHIRPNWRAVLNRMDERGFAP